MRNLSIGQIVHIAGNTRQKMGCGKSWTAVLLASRIYKDFDVEKDVVFTIKDFLKKLDSMEKNKAQGTTNAKIGQVVVLDEGQISADNRLFNSIQNRSMFYAASTFRNLRGLGIITSPMFSNIDSRIRKLFSMMITCEKTHKQRKNIVYATPYQITTDFYGDKIMPKKMMYYNTDLKKIVRIKKFIVPKPTDDEIGIFYKYEKMANKFKASLRNRLSEDIEKLEKIEGLEEKKDFVKIADEIANDKDMLEKVTTKTGTVSEHLINAYYDKIPLSCSDNRTIEKILNKRVNSGKMIKKGVDVDE